MLLRGWEKCKNFPLPLSVVLFKFLPSGYTVCRTDDSYKDSAMTGWNHHCQKYYSRGCSECCCKWEAGTPRSAWPGLGNWGDLSELGGWEISLEDQEKKKHSKLENNLGKSLWLGEAKMSRSRSYPLSQVPNQCEKTIHAWENLQLKAREVGIERGDEILDKYFPGYEFLVLSIGVLNFFSASTHLNNRTHFTIVVTQKGSH